MGKTREEKMVTLRRDGTGKPTVWCDPEIADLVDALNNGKLSTTWSCGGHGFRPGTIGLSDGRQLMIFDSLDHARPAQQAYPLDINGEHLKKPADNIIPWGGLTRNNIDPQQVIKEAFEAGLTSVVIVGLDADGDEYFASSDADGGDVLWHLERAKHKLMCLPDE